MRRRIAAMFAGGTFVALNGFFMKRVYERGFSDGKKLGYEEVKKLGYEEVKKLGYEEAKKELRNKALKCSNSAITRADQELVRVSLQLEPEDSSTTKNKFDPKVNESLQMLILPKWKFQMFDDDFIIRPTTEPDHGVVWMMPQKESDELDLKLLKSIQESTTLSEDDIINLEKETRMHMYRVFDYIAKAK